MKGGVTRQSHLSLVKRDAVYAGAGIVLFAAGVLVPLPGVAKIVLIVLGIGLATLATGWL